MFKFNLLLISIFLPIAMFSQSVWQSTSSFSAARNTHTLTILPNNTVLQVAGDIGFQDYTNLVELYDPATDTWETKAPYPLLITEHRAVLSPANTVLVFGGTNASGTVNSVYEYDVASDEWTQKSNMPTDASSQCVVKLTDGKVLLSGGWSQPPYTILSDSYVYDPQTNTYSDVIPMPLAVANHVGTLLSNGKVLIAGGFTGTAGTASSAIFDPETMIWTEVGDLPYTTTGGGKIIALGDGKALFVGGFDFSSFTYFNKISIFDSETAAWTEVNSLDYEFSNGALETLPDGTVIIIGGSNGNKSLTLNTNPPSIRSLNGIFDYGSRETLSSVMIYNPETNTLTEEESIPEPRFGGAAAQFSNGNIIITGGAAEAFSDSYDDGIIYQFPNVANPVIYASETELNFGVVPFDTVSQVMSFTINGEDLLDDILLNSSEFFEISDSAEEGFGSTLEISPNEGLVDNFIVYARFAPDSVGYFSGEITISSTDAESLTISLEGEGTIVNGLFTADNINIKVYPNPTSGIINLECNGELQLEIIDVLGKVILQKAVKDQTTLTLPSKGVYFVRGTSNNKIFIRRIIVQ